MFIGLAAVYVSEFFAILGVSLAGQAPGFAHLGTAGWLVALTSGAKLNFAAGYHLIDDTPRRGAGGRRIAFLHPKSTNGVLLELTE